MGPLIWYVNAQVRMWIILDINYKHYYHLGKSQICAGAGDYFRTSKPHSEKLWNTSPDIVSFFGTDFVYFDL